jgi:hypothetical protein
MKKLVAISVLFVCLAMAAFAQDGGWSNPWKVSLKANFTTNMFYAASASGTDKQTQETSPTGTADDQTKTFETAYGKNSKGVAHFFPNSVTAGDMYYVAGDATDRSLLLGLRNTGENYDIYIDLALANWHNGFKVMDLINGGTGEDWGIKGNAGIFNLGIGPWAVEASWVDGVAQWGSLLAHTSYNRFGVWTTEGNATGLFWQYNHFRTFGEWGTPVAVGIALGDNYKFNLGYKVTNRNWSNWNPTIGEPTDSMSSVNGVFMFSGSPADMITFDLFYAIKGSDTNTLYRPLPPTDGSGGLGQPDAKWMNHIGAYVQVKGIENLALSVGYSVFFNAWETGSYLAEGDWNVKNSSPVTYNAPVFHGVDLRLGYDGIDKIGLKWLNNFSFAGVKGTKFDKDNHDKVTLAFGESKTLDEGYTQEWFHWNSSLYANLGFIDGVGLQVALGNQLGVVTDKQDTTVPVATTTTVTDSKDTNTRNEFRAVVSAKYGVGNVTLGIGLALGVVTTNKEFEKTVTTKNTAAGTETKVKNTQSKTDNVVKFGIPVTFNVSF